MINGVKETLCSRCAKSDVCKYNELLIAVQKEVDSFKIANPTFVQPSEGQPEKTLLSKIFDGKHGISVRLDCNNFLSKEYYSGGLIK